MASTNCPLETSHCTSCAVSVNTFVVPSMVGASGWFPCVDVSLPARNASTPALCMSAICCAVIPADDIVVVPVPSAAASAPAVTVATMPRSLCPATVQYAS